MDVPAGIERLFLGGRAGRCHEIAEDYNTLLYMGLRV